MDDREILVQFEKYMQEKKLPEDKIQYNVKVASLLSNEVLFIFEQDLATIDTYCFEEFTDMVRVIDNELGGREGIRTMLEAMLLMTEFLKENKWIRGGKIAYYRRMFSNTDYYLDKYDMMTGRKDDTKNFIKEISQNMLCNQIVNLIEEVNVYDFDTILKVDKLLGDVPFGKNGSDGVTDLLRCMLLDLKLLEMRDGTMITTKKGRAFSRLDIDCRYGALLFLILDRVDWNHVIRLSGIQNDSIDFVDFKNSIVTAFSGVPEVSINLTEMKSIPQELMFVEIASERFRIARAEAMTCGMQLLDIVFIGMGLIDFRTELGGSTNASSNEVVYRTTELGQNILKLLQNEMSLTWSMRDSIGSITLMVERKNYEEAEKEIVHFLSVYGGNIKVWSYLGQLLVIKKKYKQAYQVLKNAYEHSSKRGKTAKTVLYYLVMCCRKLKLVEDLKNYEYKLMTAEKKGS